MDYPHNIWLEAAVELGAVAAGVLMFTVISALFLLFRRRRSANCISLVAALLAVEIVTSSLSGDLRARTFYFFLSLAFVVSLNVERFRTTDLVEFDGENTEVRWAFGVWLRPSADCS